MPGLTFSQHVIGIMASGGIGGIATTNYTPPEYATVKDYAQVSCSGGLFYSFYLGEKSILGVEIVYNYMQNKRAYTIEYFNTADKLIGVVTNTGYDYMSYVTLPILYSYKLKRWTPYIGFYGSYQFWHDGRLVQSGYYENEIKDHTWHAWSSMKDYDIGAIAGVMFEISDRFMGSLRLKYGLLDLKEYESSSQKHLYQITLGIKYNVLVKGVPKSTTDE